MKLKLIIALLLTCSGLMAQEYETVKVSSGQSMTLVGRTELADSLSSLRSAFPAYPAGSLVELNLANNFSSTSVTPATVTGWSFSVTSGKRYRVEVIADYQSAATTTGGIFGISLSGGATGTVRGMARGSVSASAAATEQSIPIRATSGAGSTLTTTGVSAQNTPHFLYMVITFTCTASGTFNIVWGSEVAGSAAQINANSTLIYQPLN